MSNEPITRETVESWLKGYGCACILRSGYKNQGDSVHADEHQEEAQYLERLILDAFDALQVPGQAADGSCGVTVYDLLSDAMVHQLVGALDERIRSTYPYPGSVDLVETAVTTAGTALMHVLWNWRHDPKTISANSPGEATKEPPDDIGWALNRLRTLALIGERTEQIAACEAIVRSVRVLAGAA